MLQYLKILNHLIYNVLPIQIVMLKPLKPSKEVFTQEWVNVVANSLPLKDMLIAHNNQEIPFGKMP